MRRVENQLHYFPRKRTKKEQWRQSITLVLSMAFYEDPATGTTAAALGGYLRDCNWPHAGHIDIMQ
jgi:predicted PhzF superfamily epimerase YddE/YHI9